MFVCIYFISRFKTSSAYKKVYVIRQDNQENCPTQQELDLYDTQIQELREQMQQLTEENRKLINGT
jgi:regulator of sirC expression with transglutaminase-like and TPR domain